MSTLTVTFDQRAGLLRLQAMVSDKRLRTATMHALNIAADKALEAGKKEMQRAFDRPTPWVIRSIRFKKAQENRLETTIDFNHWGNKKVTVSHVLQAEIYGSQRTLKRHEVALQRIGVLPQGLTVVPGAGAKLDQYGNMQAGQINQILAWFRAFGEQGYKANMTDKGRARLQRDNERTGKRGFAYFALHRPHGTLPPGIYQRTGFAFDSHIIPVMLFVRLPSYRAIFDFYGVAEATARREFEAAFPRMLARDSGVP
ncbi:MAG: hypothetical protein LBR95_02200 [Azoarcus sp.]|jgi:hypothetical protein|nr:hypothetical protein [Azoarcus sp.]